MTQDPNELANTPGTPTGQELAAVAGTESNTIPTPGTPSAETQQPQGDSTQAVSGSPVASQNPTDSSSSTSAEQPDTSTDSGKLSVLWDDYKQRLGISESPSS